MPHEPGHEEFDFTAGSGGFIEESQSQVPRTVRRLVYAALSVEYGDRTAEAVAGSVIAAMRGRGVPLADWASTAQVWMESGAYIPYVLQAFQREEDSLKEDFGRFYDRLEAQYIPLAKGPEGYKYEGILKQLQDDRKDEQTLFLSHYRSIRPGLTDGAASQAFNWYVGKRFRAYMGTATDEDSGLDVTTGVEVRMIATQHAALTVQENQLRNQQKAAFQSAIRRLKSGAEKIIDDDAQPRDVRDDVERLWMSLQDGGLEQLYLDTGMGAPPVAWLNQQFGPTMDSADLFADLGAIAAAPGEAKKQQEAQQQRTEFIADTALLDQASLPPGFDAAAIHDFALKNNLDPTQYRDTLLARYRQDQERQALEQEAKDRQARDTAILQTGGRLSTGQQVGASMPFEGESPEAFAARLQQASDVELFNLLAAQSPGTGGLSEEQSSGIAALGYQGGAVAGGKAEGGLQGFFQNAPGYQSLTPEQRAAADKEFGVFYGGLTNPDTRDRVDLAANDLGSIIERTRDPEGYAARTAAHNAEVERQRQLSEARKKLQRQAEDELLRRAQAPDQQQPLGGERRPSRPTRRV